MKKLAKKAWQDKASLVSPAAGFVAALFGLLTILGGIDLVHTSLRLLITTGFCWIASILICLAWREEY